MKGNPQRITWPVTILASIFILQSGYSANDLKFEIHQSDMELTGLARPGVFCEAIGKKAALLGTEQGVFEAWVYPFRILHDLQLFVQLRGQSQPFELGTIARQVTVRPEATTITYSHPNFTICQTFFVPINEPGMVILLDIDTNEPMTVIVNFLPDLKPMWPAGLGGQFCYWDDKTRAYIISESRWKYSGLIGCPEGAPRSVTLAHQLTTAPTQFAIEVEPEKARQSYIPIVIAGSISHGLKELKSTAECLLSKTAELYAETVSYYHNLNQTLLIIVTPDQQLNLALEWAKVAMDKGIVVNPHLGEGLVAGFGTSGVGCRPGFAWFFGGDAFMNSMGMLAYGDFEKVRNVFTFLQKYQRDDGKIMHELSQSGGIIDWFGEYHYGYIHGDTTPWYIAQMADYLARSGDVDFVLQSWDSIIKAYQWCLGCDSDGDGLMDNSKAGLGASELGTLRQNIQTDVYLASLWVQALSGMERMSQLIGDKKKAKQAAELYQKALSSLQAKFTNSDKGIINFALTREGGVNDEVTSWPAVPMLFEQFKPEQVASMLDRFASSELSTDWGTRMLSNQSDAYEPLAYNNGAVWPFLTGFVSLAEYRYHRSVSAYQHLMDVAQLCFNDALGYHTELLSGDFYRALNTSVPHQIFSSSQFYNACVRGLLGLDGDALNKTLTFAPHLPTNWDSVKVRNYRVGSSQFYFELSRKSEFLQVLVNNTDNSNFKLHFAPALPLGAKIEKVQINQKQHHFDLLNTAHDVHPEVKTPLGRETTIEVKWQRGLEIVPIRHAPAPGDRTHSLKVIHHTLENDTHHIALQGLAGETYKLKIRTPQRILETKNAQLVESRGDHHTLEVSFQVGSGYKHKTIEVMLD